ncbi:hypothetical protein DSL72_004481 [Monilinia vaccinii-corymbosi]|uniref:FAD-binding PCMH-type domain-containing protein n=1 Tax=Monilinia vaccinii-corymbosi TaxID=61207 RepID=A0A8A3NWS2_9HELO|nr:hypothetical protein DSL72_004481 [Monilinia vaccinii-corymbosi]
MLRINLLLPLLCFLSAAANADDVDTIIKNSLSSVTTTSAKDTKNENICCKALQYGLGSKVSYPNSPKYSTFLSSFYSKQEAEQSPSCIVSPTSAAEVSISVSILSFLANYTGFSPSCQFAIRSRGHGPNALAANIDKGVTIDLRALRKIDVTKDKSVVSVGPAASWGEVYSKLDKLQISVPGGRIDTVGVGGLTIGGGISYFSPRKGFTCDSVKNFEVVLANGTIVNANAKKNSDLWVALKGGSNNFGVVTRIDFNAFKQGDIWGGNIMYDISTAEKQIDALADFSSNPNYDEYASLMTIFAFQPSSVGRVIVNNIVYTKPVANPPVYKPFTAIQPQFSSSMRISNLTSIVSEKLAISTQQRTLFLSTTFKADKRAINTIYNAWNASLDALGKVENLTLTLTLEPIPTSVTAKSAPAGGNVLGLDPAAGSLIIAALTVTWDKISNDKIVIAAAQKMYNTTEKFTKDSGLYNDWLYLNYAAVWQDPIARYGKKNQAMLRQTSVLYDPQNIFQRAVTGGFKLFVGWGWL